MTYGRETRDTKKAVRERVKYFLTRLRIAEILFKVDIDSAMARTPMSQYCILKGKVARDFWPLVFFMNQPHMGP